MSPAERTAEEEQRQKPRHRPSEPETRRASLHGFLSGFSLSPDCDYEEDEVVTQMDRC